MKHLSIKQFVTGMSLSFLSAVSVFNATAETTTLSYGVKTSDPVYPYTGFSTNEDVDDMSVAIKFDKDMLTPYVGGQIKALHIGWAGIYQSYAPNATAFVRENLNGDNLATGEGSLASNNGWVRIELAQDVTIASEKDIYIGYTVDMHKGVYGPCTITWGSFPEDTHFISRPDYTDPETGLPEWIDLSQPGMMEMPCPIMLVAEIESNNDELNNIVLLSKVINPSVVVMGEPATGVFNLTNKGINAINAITVSYEQTDGSTWDMDVDLSANPIAGGDNASVAVPVCLAGKGKAQARVSKVNGEVNKLESSVAIAPFVVSEETAERYVRRPLVEYIASESDYNSARYLDDIVEPALTEFNNDVTRVNWHVDDQFQLGLADDKDEALDMLVDIAGGNPYLVYLPTVMVDRDMNLGAGMRIAQTFYTPMIGVLFSPYAELTYDYALSQPTFAGLDVAASIEGETVNVTVSGDADLSVLEDDEELYLTVLLLEDGVETDSQEFPAGKDDTGATSGYYVHNNLVRQRLTDIWGDPVAFDDDKFEVSLSADIYEDYNPDKLHVVAFLNRGKDNSIWAHNVINSAEAYLVNTAVDKVDMASEMLRPEVVNGHIVCPEGATMEVFNTAGSAVSANPAPGMYVVRVKGDNGQTATFKILVK